MKPVIALCVLALATTTFAQKPDTQMLPDDHLAYHYISELKRSLRGDTVGKFRTPPMSRSEAATLTRDVLLKASATFKLTERSDDETWFAQTMSYQWWQVTWMANEFQQELEALGFGPSVSLEIILQCRAAITRERLGVKFSNGYFVDVPPGHWADEAIHNLRRARIIFGYPDGTFRG